MFGEEPYKNDSGRRLSFKARGFIVCLFVLCFITHYQSGLFVRAQYFSGKQNERRPYIKIPQTSPHPPPPLSWDELLINLALSLVYRGNAASSCRASVNMLLPSATVLNNSTCLWLHLLGMQSECVNRLLYMCALLVRICFWSSFSRELSKLDASVALLVAICLRLRKFLQEVFRVFWQKSW